MFEFIMYPSYLSSDFKTSIVDTTPIHIAATNMATRAAELTVQQFNQACEAVCNEQTQQAE